MGEPPNPPLLGQQSVNLRMDLTKRLAARGAPLRYDSFALTSVAEVRMASSRQIAGLVGPVLCAVLISEFPLVQPHLYDTQIPPVVYLSGILFFVAGLAIVRAHNLWVRAWPVLITVTGWFFLVLGLIRMFAAGQYRQASASASSTTFMVLEGILLLVALAITYFGYRREPQQHDL